MLRILRHYLPLRRALLIFSETVLLTVVLAVAMTAHLLKPSANVIPSISAEGLGLATAQGLCAFSAFLVAVLCQVVIAFNDLYDFRVSGSRYDRASRFVASTGSAVVVSLIVALLARVWNLGRVLDFPGLSTSQLVKTLVFALLFAFALLYLWRHLFHFALRKWNFNDRVLILGAGPAARSLAQEILERADSGYEAVGLIPESAASAHEMRRTATLASPEPAARIEHAGVAATLVASIGAPAATSPELTTLLLDPLPISEAPAHPGRGYGSGNGNGNGHGNGNGNGHGPQHGASATLVELVKRMEVDLVVVALDDRRGHLPTDELLTCRLAGVSVQEREAIYERITGKIAVEAMRPSYLIFNDGFGRSGAGELAQRGVDIVLSTVGLLLAWPLMLATALAIRFDSPGPVLFEQERVGRDGAQFRLFKFRSMRSDAEKLTGPVWATENDPRITRAGRFIRKTRLDELPQLFNVILGDMSLVGPRPERAVFVAELAKQIPYYNQRHIVKPGLTGWAQINYPYGNTVEDALNKLQYDLFYIKHRSVLFDLSILFQTVRTVLLRKGT
jgi:lipopolysaccharide/colanic/teichoic acid biosynthesis glycosyltransferase